MYKRQAEKAEAATEEVVDEIVAEDATPVEVTTEEVIETTEAE